MWILMNRCHFFLLLYSAISSHHLCSIHKKCYLTLARLRQVGHPLLCDFVCGSARVCAQMCLGACMCICMCQKWRHPLGH